MGGYGGVIVGQVLAEHGITHLFTLCGGHISPILTGADEAGIRVVDVRDEASAVFAADAAARLTGTVGLAAVTAGPGVTNTLTAVKNAQLAQTPLVLLGGATATLLRGRGALQDIDQLALLRPATKWATRVTRVLALRPAIAKAIRIATQAVPGPVFVEIPVDLVYPEPVVRDMYAAELGKAKDLAGHAVNLYVKGHLLRQFHQPPLPGPRIPQLPTPSLTKVDVSRRRVRLPRLPVPGRSDETVRRVGDVLARAERPVIVAGSQTLSRVRDPQRVADAVKRLGVPVYLAGMARGLLGRRSVIQFRHERGKALREADLVIVCGFPFDFRLGYGRTISGRATVVAANLSAEDLTKNRVPDIAVRSHPGDFLCDLAGSTTAEPERLQQWVDTLTAREHARDAEIAAQASKPGELINPVHLFTRVEQAMAPDATIIADGGDFVATASYIVRPRAPLSWLDPGVFGTLGVGGGMALAAGLLRPTKELWLLWGDGSSAFSLAELDSCARHGVAPIALIGNDASWAQIAREQLPMLGTALGTELARCDYHTVAQGYGAKGLLLTDPNKIDDTLAEAQTISAAGHPVCLNVHLRRSEFRRGSISI
jgi:thiamine pyrophosphate-dependent acetolactate synthase large subunit-like protein